MKKSQAISAIDNVLCNEFFNSRKEPDGSWDTYSLAKDILDRLLDLGMMPPIVEEESWKMLDNGEMTYAVQRWEAE